MVSSFILISKSPCTFTTPLMTVLSAPIKTGLTDTFMFHSFLVLQQGLSTYLSVRFLSFIIIIINFSSGSSSSTAELWIVFRYLYEISFE